MSSRYLSTVAWGHPPVPLIPFVLRERYADSEAPLSNEMTSRFGLLCRDLDATFWSRGIELSQSDRDDLSSWCQQHLDVVRYAPILPKSLSKPVSVRDMAMSHNAQQSIVELTQNDAFYPHLTHVAKLHRESTLARHEIIELMCIVEAAVPDVSDISFQRGFEFEDDFSDAVSNLFRAVVDERQRTILHDRILAHTEKLTINELSTQLKLDQDLVRQIELETNRKLVRALKAEEYSSIKSRARTLRDSLGSAVPTASEDLSSYASRCIDDVRDTEIRRFAKLLLIHLAGPYKRHGRDWLVVDRKLSTQIERELESRKDARNCISSAVISQILSDFGILPRYREAWLRIYRNFIPIDGDYLVCEGDYLDKVEMLLKHYNRPMTPRDLQSHLEKRNERAIRYHMMSDNRFWRINKQAEFVFANAPGYSKYEGITTEINKLLKTHGRPDEDYRLPMKFVVDTLTERFGVTPNSVAAYAKTGFFKREVVDKVEYVSVARIPSSKAAKDIRESGRCFYLDDTWFWRITVNPDWIRGSGRTCPDAFAEYMGCKLNESIKIPSPIRPISFGWKASSPSGSHIGSLKSVINHFGLNIGDHLFIGRANNSVAFRPLRDEQVRRLSDQPVRRLACEIGLGPEKVPDTPNILEEICETIGMTRQSIDESSNIYGSIHQWLRRRGDRDLAELVPTSQQSADRATTS